MHVPSSVQIGLEIRTLCRDSKRDSSYYTDSGEQAASYTMRTGVFAQE